MAEAYVTSAAQELALREAIRSGNRHMKRKGRKLLRGVPPPTLWYAFEHPQHGVIGIRPAVAGAKLENEAAQARRRRACRGDRLGRRAAQGAGDQHLGGRVLGRYRLTPTAAAHRARERAVEVAALQRLSQPHALLDTEFAEIVRDPYAGIAREIADTELRRREGLTAHQRVAEAAKRAE